MMVFLALALVVRGASALVAVEEILTLLMVKDLMMQYALMVEEVHAVLTFLVVAEALLVQ